VNDAGAALASSFPDRFGHFATLPLPDTGGALAELSRALDELGSDGVTVETNAGGRYLGDARYEPLYAELDRRRAVVFVHPTSPPDAERLTAGRPRPMLEFIFDTARTVADLAFTGALSRWPAIQWVFTHGAGVLPLMAARMELFRVGLTAPDPGEPTIPDQLARLWFDLAGTPFPHQAPAAAAAFGTSRLLYGSDYCWTPAPAVAAQIASLDQAPGPDGTTWRALTTGNAARLFAAGGPDPRA
jgi:predicted TIM-barrel fold metal-dependent hydrolase